MCGNKRLVRWTAESTWGDGIRVLKRGYWSNPMRLLQPSIPTATMSLFHRTERPLLIDAPQRHRAEGVQKIERGIRKRTMNESGTRLWRSDNLTVAAASILPVISSRYHVLLVYELDAINWTAVGRQTVTYDGTLLSVECPVARSNHYCHRTVTQTICPKS